MDASARMGPTDFDRKGFDRASTRCTVTPTPAETNTAINAQTLTQWVDEAFGGLLRGELNEASTALLFKVIVPALVSIVMIIAIYFVAKLLSRWTASSVCKRVDETLGKFAGRLVFYGILTIGSLGILSKAGISVAGAAAVLTAAGFAIGLAFQGTLSNFASGVLLLVFRPFKVGDTVIVGGVNGKVNEIDLFTTTLDTPDNRRLILPNSSISGTTIENSTFHQHRRVDVVVGVAYRADIEQTRAVLIEAVESLSEMMIPGPDRGYTVALTNLGPSSVDWAVRFWTPKATFGDAKERLLIAIKQRLDANGIQIPFPQLQLHFDDDAATTISSATMTEPIATSNTFSGAMPLPRMAQATVMSVPKTRPRVRGEAS